MSKAFLRDPGTCRMMYFSDDMPPAEVDRLQRLLARHASPVPVVDVRTCDNNADLLAPGMALSNRPWSGRCRGLARVVVLHSFGGKHLLG